MDRKRMQVLAGCLLVLLLALLMSACNLSINPTAVAVNTTAPSATPSETSAPILSHTAAAETIVAQLTALAEPSAQPETTSAAPLAMTPTSILTQQPTFSPMPSDTSTPEVKASATLASEVITPTASVEAASETPQITPTITPTQVTPQPSATSLAPTATSSSSDPRAQLGQPDWVDPFNDGLNWPLFNDEHVNMQVKDGALEMVALTPGPWESWMLTSPVASDFYLEITATPSKDCAGLDRYGLLARASSISAMYVYGFSCDGRYSLRTWDGTQFRILVDWTANPAIHSGGESNRLGFWAQGDQIRLFANGVLLQELSDSTYTSGNFGLFIGAASTPGFTVLVDEVTYWALGE